MTNDFNVKKIKDDKILLEEIDNRKHGVIWLFYNKYGRIINMVLALVAFFVLLIGMILSYDIFLGNAKKIYVIQEKEYVKFGSNQLSIGNLAPLNDDKVADDKNNLFNETVVSINNTSLSKNIHYLIVVSEILHDNRLNPSNLLYSVSIDGGKTYTEPKILNSKLDDNLEDLEYILYEGDLNKNESVNLKLRIWIPETGEDQNDLQGKVFKGKINIYYSSE